MSDTVDPLSRAELNEMRSLDRRWACGTATMRQINRAMELGRRHEVALRRQREDASHERV